MKDLRTFTNMLKQLNFIFTKEEKRDAGIVFIFTIVAAIFEMLGVAILLPFIQILVDAEKLHNSTVVNMIMGIFKITTTNGLVVFLLVAIVGVYIVKNLILLLAAVMQIAFRNKVKRELGMRMLSSYLERPYSFFLKTNSAVIMRGVSNDVQGVYVILEGLMQLTKEMLTVFFISLFLFVTDGTIAIAVFVFAATCALCAALLFKKPLREAGKLQREANSEYGKALYQSVTGIKEIKVSKTDEVFIAQATEAAEVLRVTANKNGYISALPERIIEVGCVIVLMTWVGIKILSGGNLEGFIVTLGILAVGAFRMLPSVSRIVGHFNHLVFYRSTLEGAYENMEKARKDEKEEVYIQPVSVVDKQRVPFKECIKIKNLTWQYEDTDEPVLRNLSMSIKKGEAVGIIGGSGAGKTTLIDSILGLLEPQDGTIEMDGVNIYSMLSDWAKVISYVPQSVFLLDDTIRTNVAFGIEKSTVDDEQVWCALEKAQLSDFVRSLPKGLDTVVGERGIRFSGGQRQRVAIARALYNNPDILVLDEATSALDTSTESAVMEAINNLKGKITLIIVAHRLSTIQGCDNIYEVKDGIAIGKDKKEILYNS